ncbi:hypothetical protein JOE68_000771 [Saccharothrix algeriensis]|uniref:Uncharacterized protein n=1 Tax=Saccharothrix algeriensis TaxID=173560 RepID=A0ABS2S486_9PSEU|nr:hypothetical protein [Saccharothrix algeriensis]
MTTRHGTEEDEANANETTVGIPKIPAPPK